MKKMFFIAVVMLLTILPICSYAGMQLYYDGAMHEYTGPEITLFINTMKFEVTEGLMPPVIINNRTLVPLREVFEENGATVVWYDDERAVELELGNGKIKLWIDQYVAEVNGEKVEIDVPAKIINSKTMVPVRFITEKCGYNVEWDDTTKTVTIDDSPLYAQSAMSAATKFSMFCMKFFDYSIAFKLNNVPKYQEVLTIADKKVNRPKAYYCAANNIDIEECVKLLEDVEIPAGYTSKRFQTDIRGSDGEACILADSDTPVYQIKDGIVKDFENKKFYDDTNGTETHWITASGTVFTLPGYPMTKDGEDRMYINDELYYVPASGGMLCAEDLEIYEARLKNVD